MKRSGSRRGFLAALISIVVLQAGVPQRIGAQWRTETVPGLRFGPPLRAGLAVALAYGQRDSLSQFAGAIALVEPGIGGARGSIGYIIAGPFASALEVLGSAVRTWGSPAQVERNRTLVGGELRVAYFAVNVGLAIMQPVGDVWNDRRRRYYLNVGLGI
jgi:hypothetical protein